MAIFVLVHGMWHGGWCWKKVTPLLRAAGHEVYTPTLTGLGEMVVFGQAAHMAHLEKPEHYVQVVRGLLHRVENRSDSIGYSC